MSNLFLNLEVRLKTADSNQWSEQPVSTNQPSVDINWKLSWLPLDEVALSTHMVL